MIIGILGPGGCGGTFLDWTIQYLSGQDSYWFIECSSVDRGKIGIQKKMQLVSDPIKENTAHNHSRTHPNDVSVDKVIELLKIQTSFDLNTFYYVDSMDNGKRIQTNYNRIIKDNLDIQFIRYIQDESDIDKIFCFQIEKIFSSRNSFFSLILGDHEQQLSQLPVWDRRELLSLYYPKCIKNQILSEPRISMKNTYDLRFKTMLHSLDQEIFKLFEWAHLSIDANRFKDWQKKYQQWQYNNQCDLFFENLLNIIDDILVGKDHDLGRYHMTFAKEIIIANKLLYDHNKALKSYGITDLSKNALQWTEILEENTYHNLKESI